MAERASQTFLFADLAGFTALTEAHGDERAADLVGEFCQGARQLLPDYGAEQVKAIGDALMLRVADADRALQLAERLVGDLGSQHGFPSLRVGMHTGPAVERDGDWYGAAVNLASRVCGAATAGEILLTAATRAAAGEAGFDLQPRGSRRFKNVSEPVELFALASEAPSRLVTDPICHMALDPDRAAARRVDRGEERFFCSQACVAAFDRQPSRYRKSSAGAELRVSDDAREDAGRLLRSARRRGRITEEELEARLAQAHLARTRGELNELLGDLPGSRRRRRAERLRGLLPWRLRRRQP